MCQQKHGFVILLIVLSASLSPLHPCVPPYLLIAPIQAPFSFAFLLTLISLFFPIFLPDALPALPALPATTDALVTAALCTLAAASVLLHFLLLCFRESPFPIVKQKGLIVVETVIFPIRLYSSYLILSFCTFKFVLFLKFKY